MNVGVFPERGNDTERRLDARSGHQAALRQLANRWVGIFHGCLRHRTFYEESTAWQHHLSTAA